MRKISLILGALALFASPITLSAAPNGPSGSPRIQGVPDGYGDPVQVTIVAADGDAADPGGGVAQGSTTSGQSGQLVQCATTTSAPTYVTAKTNPLSCDTSGNLRVATGGTAQGAAVAGVTGGMVQGVATTAAPSYTTATVNPLSLDTAGALRVTGTITSGGVAQGSTTSGQTGGLVQGAVTTAAPSYTTAQTSPLSLDTGGALRVTNALGATVAKQPALGTAGTASADVITVQGVASMTPLLVTPTANSAVNAAQINGVTPLMGNGTTGTGSLRVTLASDTTSNTNPLLVNQSQVNGVAVSTGYGVAGTGTQRVVTPTLEYEAVAASATNQVMGATGATGDYLSHCVIMPATTAAGAVTIYDNATALYTYTAGTLSDLKPWTIVFGVATVSGAVKVTTSTNVSVTCYGDFL